MTDTDSRLAALLARVREAPVPPTATDLGRSDDHPGDAGEPVEAMLREAASRDLVLVVPREGGEPTYSLTLDGHALVGRFQSPGEEAISPY